jgi:ABC-type anion transport system duplicated permease subunit
MVICPVLLIGMDMAWHGGMVGESVVGIHELEWTHGHGHGMA